ncbi:MAG: hypothetical protein VYC39_19790 [Myxococcota bacterium]|nr:hypothetical protein [Myxococcota bacterium]
MDNQEPENLHPAVEFLLESLVQDEAKELQLPEDAYVELHAWIARLEKAKELSSLAQSLLDVAVNLDQKHRAESASTHVGLLAKAAADKAIALNSTLTNSLDRVSRHAEQYQTFSAHPQSKQAPLIGQKPKTGTFRLGDLDPQAKKA